MRRKSGSAEGCVGNEKKNKQGKLEDETDTERESVCVRVRTKEYE